MTSSRNFRGIAESSPLLLGQRSLYKYGSTGPPNQILIRSLKLVLIERTTTLFFSQNDGLAFVADLIYDWLTADHVDKNHSCSANPSTLHVDARFTMLPVSLMSGLIAQPAIGYAKAGLESTRLRGLGTLIGTMQSFGERRG